MPLHEDFHFRVTNGQRAEVKRACTAKEYLCFPRPLRHKEVFCFTSVSPQQLQIFNFIQKGLIMRERLTKSDVEKIKAEIIPEVRHTARKTAPLPRRLRIRPIIHCTRILPTPTRLFAGTPEGLPRPAYAYGGSPRAQRSFSASSTGAAGAALGSSKSARQAASNSA